MKGSWKPVRVGARRHIFRIWTAGAVLAAYVYGWLYVPEVLTWWKRATSDLVDGAIGLLPYPWNDRVDATLGNFGLWVQITLAVIVFRIAVWLAMSGLRGMWRRRRSRRLDRVRLRRDASLTRSNS